MTGVRDVPGAVSSAALDRDTTVCAPAACSASAAAANVAPVVATSSTTSTDDGAERRATWRGPTAAVGTGETGLRWSGPAVEQPEAAHVEAASDGRRAGPAARPGSNPAPAVGRGWWAPT